MRMWTRLRDWARTIKRDIVALYIAARDPRVPWYVKLAAAAVAAYALSPIDLIPDFIPMLGYLDEVIILPVAIFLVINMIPVPLGAARCQTRGTMKPWTLVTALVLLPSAVAAQGPDPLDVIASPQEFDGQRVKIPCVIRDARTNWPATCNVYNRGRQEVGRIVFDLSEFGFRNDRRRALEKCAESFRPNVNTQGCSVVLTGRVKLGADKHLIFLTGIVVQWVNK
jgi:uncharacterized membrane protein YkvA (DUF1232 family)